MSDYSTEREEVPQLLAEVMSLLAGARGAFNQDRTHRRGAALVFGALFTFARHTVTQELRALGLIDVDWSAFYRLFSRRRYDPRGLESQLLQETLADISWELPYVVGIDGVRIPRTGRHVGGVSWWPAQDTAPFQRGLKRAQRFVEVAWLTPLEKGYSRAVPLRWEPAISQKAVASIAEPRKEWEAGVELLKWVRRELDEAGRESQQLLVLADGGYDINDIWNQVPERTTLMVRCAKNRALYHLPGAGTGKRGRPRDYGARLPRPDSMLRQKGDWDKRTVLIRGRERTLQYRVVGPVLVQKAADHPLYLVIVRGKQWQVGKRRRRTLRRKPAYYLVAAEWKDEKWELPLPIEDLLVWAWQRWEVEVAHREMKSSFGVGEKQCWGPRSALVSVQWSVWVYAVLVLAGYRTWGITGGPRLVGRWWRKAHRWSFSALWQAYRSALWGCGDFRALWTATADNWTKKEAWIAGLWNAVGSSARI